MRPPSPNNRNESNPMTNNERGTMRHPSPNNKNGSASTTFQMAIKMMEQYQRNEQMMQEQYQRNQQMMLETFMKQQEIQTKLLIEIIQRKNGRLNIDTTQLMNNLGEQNNVSETRTDDINAAATEEKPVPRHWLDWVERTKQNKQKCREESANDRTTND